MESGSEKDVAHEVRTPSNESTSSPIEGKRDAEGILLEPQPSDDPRDPLNWPTYKKITITAVLSLASFAGVAQSGANVSGIVVQSFTYHVGVGDMVNSLSASLGGTCSGPIIAMALAHYIGRGPVIFWGLLLSLACNVWAAGMTQADQYIAFTLSRWLGSTFGAFPTALGGGYIIDLWFLHQRGKAFACYTTCALFGIAFANTLSGFIVNDRQWPDQFWWAIALLGLSAVLCFFLLEDTTYARGTAVEQAPKRNNISHKILTFFPVRGNQERASNSQGHGPFDSILIGIQPTILLGGFFISIIFMFSTAILNNLAVYLQLPPSPIAGGYGFTPKQNAYFTFVHILSTMVGQIYGLLFNDSVPLWRCKRTGGVWKPEYRLYPLLFVPMALSPIALGLFGAGLQYHLHFMVLALSTFLLNIADVVCMPIITAYCVESFLDYAAEVTTILTFYRLVLGLTISFFLTPWTNAVGIGWTYGMMAFFVIIAYALTWILECKGPQIREKRMTRFVTKQEGGAKLFTAYE